ncbi:hypothetical protein BJY00DRAFT_319126 [Aspergillus carlsbadensis]|nr:hypothetical protein BJY00DRAFT_319126 [Aspergillus carlsbadensis]
MNYTIVINGFVWIACMAYYYLYAHRFFTGPRTTLGSGTSSPLPVEAPIATATATAMGREGGEKGGGWRVDGEVEGWRDGFRYYFTGGWDNVV